MARIGRIQWEELAGAEWIREVSDGDETRINWREALLRAEVEDHGFSLGDENDPAAASGPMDEPLAGPRPAQRHQNPGRYGEASAHG